MIKKSVQKPFLILVVVIIVLVLGGVSLTRMSTDLLPEMSMPYMMVITTYPGATPEKVEGEVTKPIENELGTINGVTNVTSSSAENYSMVMLEFESDTNMDSALVKVNAGMETVKGELPEMCGTPNVLELSMDMMATLYTSVSYEGYDIYELSEFVEETVVPYFERQNGVASITNIGLVEQTIEVRLNQEKINAVNAKVLAQTNDKLQDAQNELADAKKELSSSKTSLEEQKAALEQQQTATNSQLADATLQLNEAIATRAAYESQLASLNAQKAALEAELKAYEDNKVEENYNTVNASFATMQESMGAYAAMAGITIPTDIPYALEHTEELKAYTDWMTGLGYGDAVAALTEESLKSLNDIVNVRIPQIETDLANMETKIAGVEALVDAVDEQMEGIDEQYKQATEGSLSASSSFGAANAQFAAADTAIADAESQMEEAEDTLNDSIEAAAESANIDALLEIETLSGLITAQNFSMPAGYIDDERDSQWMLKVGDENQSLEELQTMVLCNIDDIGDVTLSDVADITVIDNADESYATVNGQPSVLLSIFKGSTASTSETSQVCNEAAAELEAQYEGLSLDNFSDQGDYINMFIKNILTSILFGAILAIVVLIVFMKDIKPTLVVAFSIPFSVLMAIVFMFFTGISINIMSLAGLSLAIGMLVDNSIVIIENIYRLRRRGLAAPRAAVQGAKQVASAIISSTLTTICVFLPMIFTTGYVRQLMLPLALTITFSLVASLIVALTVVPTMGAVLLKRTRTSSYPLFEKIQNVYGKLLAYFLKVKIIPLGIAVALLIFSGYEVVQMGISMLPDMTSDQISATVTVPEDTEKEEAYALADQVTEAMMSVENIEAVGVMSGAASQSMMSGMAANEDYSSFVFYIIPDEEATKVNQINKICKDIEKATTDLGCEVNVTASAMGDMSALMGNGVAINVQGEDLDALLATSEDLEAMLAEVEGCIEITNGQEEADAGLHLVIDKNEAMRNGLTVAQIYSEISTRLTTESTATSMTVDENQMDVQIVDETDTLTKENILDMEFETTTRNDEGEEETETHKLSEFASLEESAGVVTIERDNNERYMTVSADLDEGYNITLVSREIQSKLDDYTPADGVTIEFGGETETTRDMVEQMGLMLAIGILLIYLIMVAQFQSLLSPFIVILTVPLAFTGGLLGLLIAREQMTMMSLIGFLVLMGTVVNNGIVFVDYTNQLRLGGMKKHDALVATGKTRMRPILMTAMTTILAMCPMIFSQDTGNAMGKGMAIVIVGGLLYATLMTLFVVPVMYDILYRRQPKLIDVGDDTIDDVPDDAAEFIAEIEAKKNHTIDQ